MALKDDLLQGLKAADAAGDTQAAQHFATQLKNMAEPITDYSKASIAAGSKPTGNQLAADRILEATQGLGLNFGDEAAGVIGGIDSLVRGKNSKTGQDTFGGGYDATVKKARSDLANYEQARPLEAMGLNVLGSLPTVAIAAPEALAAKATLPARMAQAAKTGAKVGAVAGAGAGDGDVGDRTASAVKGALTGGLLSAAIPTVPAAFGAAKGAVNRFTQSAPEFGLQKLANAVDKDGVTLDPTKPFIDQVPTEGRTAQLAEQAALSGEGRTTAADFFKKDAQAREGSLTQTIKNAVTDAPMYDVMDDLNTQRMADAKPLYQQAYQSPYRRTPRLMDLLSRPATGGAMRAAYTRVLNDPDLDPNEVREALGPVMGDNPDNATDAQLQQRLTQAMGTRPVEFKVLDYIKRGMDKLVEDNPGASSEVRRLRNAYRTELKNINPNYQSALNAWAGPSAVMDAIEQGRAFDKMDPEAISRAMGDMSDSEQQGFQVGVSRRLQDMASGASSQQPGQNASLRLARGIEGNSVMQRRLQAALGSAGQDAPTLLQRNGWRPQGNGVFTNTTKPGVQVTLNDNGTWGAGQLSKSGKSVSVQNAGPDTSSLESFLTGKPIAQRAGPSSVDDLVSMASDLKNRADKANMILGNSATARRLQGAQDFDAPEAALSMLGGPKGMALYALKSKLGNLLTGMTNARRAAVSNLLYSDDPVQNRQALQAIQQLRAGKAPSVLSENVQRTAPALVGAQAGSNGSP